MIKVYIPETKTKQGKASIRGLWKGGHGLCYDYLRRVDIEASRLRYVKKHYKQEALFYREKNKAYVWYGPRKIETLKHQTYFGYNKRERGLKAYIKALLKTYGGLTVYVREDNFLFEAWRP